MKSFSQYFFVIDGNKLMVLKNSSIDKYSGIDKNKL